MVIISDEGIFGFCLVNGVVFSVGLFFCVVVVVFRVGFFLGFDYVDGEFEVFVWVCYYNLFGIGDDIKGSFLVECFCDGFKFILVSLCKLGGVKFNEVCGW